MEPSPRQTPIPGALSPVETAQLFQRYAERLIGLARSRLDGRVCAKVDPEDVLQSVFRSFCRGNAECRWDFNNENDLWHLLVSITIRKCNRRLAHFFAARRDVRREVESADAERGVADLEPTPDEAAMLADAAETVMNRLGSPIKRRIFELSLQGYSIGEISDQVGYYTRGVQRVRAEIRSLLQAMMQSEPEA
jgi:DNA-directed RNA polymerase specialized sigma24 family protein